MKNFFHTINFISKHINYKGRGFRFFTIDSISGKRIKARFRCRDEDRKNFKGAHCLLPISVGQLSHDVSSPHEGAKFKSTIELINRAEFGKCTILVDDTIQLDTYAILHKEKNDKQLYQIALSVGDEWMARHASLCEKLTMDCQIKRWSSVENDPDFPNAVKQVEAKYFTNEVYKNAFNENINIFLKRLEKRNIQFDREYSSSRCLQYLIKENAAMGFVWPKWGAHFEIYPNGRNPSMAATHEFFIKPYYPDLLRPVALRFKKSNFSDSSPALQKQQGYGFVRPHLNIG